jgi:hypothetical protein
MDLLTRSTLDLRLTHFRAVVVDVVVFEEGLFGALAGVLGTGLFEDGEDGLLVPDEPGEGVGLELE